MTTTPPLFSGAKEIILAEFQQSKVVHFIILIIFTS